MKQKRRRWKCEDNIFPSVTNAKEEICWALRKAVQQQRMTQDQIAALLHTSQATVSRAIRYPTAKSLSFNQLFRYLSILQPRFRIMISF